MDTFGYALRDAREAAGLGLREFAAKMGISPSYLSDVERGFRQPFNEEVVENIETMLGVKGRKLVTAAREHRLHFLFPGLSEGARRRVVKIIQEDAKREDQGSAGPKPASKGGPRESWSENRRGRKRSW